MTARSIVAVSVVALATAACAPREGATGSDGTWVGTITTEGNVTTVVNESGSVWGGTATLVEEASIGVETGAEEYMLARVASVAASEDRIYVLEQRPPVLRVYDFDGMHLLNMGREGQGPGEFSTPVGVALAPDGTVFVRDVGNARYSLFNGDGELVDTWPLGGSAVTFGEGIVSAIGTPYSPQPVIVDSETRARITGFVPYGPDGPLGDPLMPPEIDYEQPRLRSGSSSGPVPYYPSHSYALSPHDAIVSGVGIEYAIEVRYFDGRVTRIVRNTPPVLVSSDEAAWRQRAETAYWRGEDVGWSWSGPGVPDRKPFFDRLYVDAGGRIWVSRSGPSIRVETCDENPEPGETYTACWQNTMFTEVFDADGRFLGEIDFPQYRGFQSNFMRGETVIKQVQDAAGTIMVKRYRLVLRKEE